MAPSLSYSLNSVGAGAFKFLLLFGPPGLFCFIQSVLFFDIPGISSKMLYLPNPRLCFIMILSRDLFVDLVHC